MSKLSYEEYYHGAGASPSVPFDWESQPGTPKVKFRETYSLPPLTPPPSFSHTPTRSSRSIRKASKANLLSNIFPKHGSTTKKVPHVLTSPAFSSSSFSSHSSSSPTSKSHSVPCSPITPLKFHERNQSMKNGRRLSIGRHDEEYDHEEYDSSFTTLCFGWGAKNAWSRSLYSSFIKVFLRDFQ